LTSKSSVFICLLCNAPLFYYVAIATLLLVLNKHIINNMMLPRWKTVLFVES